jgi:release factor glutamine methyltransferase
VPATAGALLQAARVRLAATSTYPRRDADLLLAHTLSCKQIDLFAHPERPLSEAECTQFESLVTRRIAHEPIQYILGEQEFYGLLFEVTPSVLIPRPETEHLVEAVLKRADPQTNLRIIDVGTGSGAIAIALAHKLPQVQVIAVDISLAALAVARRNAIRHSVIDQITFVQSDLLAAFGGNDFDLVVSNPPYIANTEVLEPQVVQFEPHTALYAGPTGLEIYQRLIPQASDALKRNGWLLMEIGYGQNQSLLSLLEEWNQVTIDNDLQEIPRVLSAKKP